MSPAKVSHPKKSVSPVSDKSAAAAKRALIAALTTMPDEAFGWFVLACPRSAMTKGGLAQIWPDGMGGFSSASQASVDAIRNAADAYLNASAKER